MPTLQEWQTALTSMKRIFIDASQQLAGDVNALPASKSFQGTPKQAVSPQPQIPNSVDLTAADLLLALGKITTPRIQNLVDLSNQWAYYRYIWAFEPTRAYSNLRLSQDATEIDSHQKAVMSDDMGIGFTAYVMENFFSAPTAMDVTVALRNQFIPGLLKQFSTSPDYLFQDQQGNYFVVECKGTRQSRKPVLTQLRRGLEQVPSLVFPTRQQPTRLVIGARLARQSIEIYIIDPPSPGDESSKQKSGKQRRTFDISDEKKFEDDVDSIERANLYLYAGVTGKAIEALPDEREKEKLRKRPVVDEPPTRIRSQELAQDFVGSRQTLRFSAGREQVSIFQGIANSVYEELERNVTSVERTGSAIFNRAQHIARERRKHEGQTSVISDLLNRTLRVDVFSKDGSMLRIEVRE